MPSICVSKGGQSLSKKHPVIAAQDSFQSRMSMMKETSTRYGDDSISKTNDEDAYANQSVYKARRQSTKAYSSLAGACSGGHPRGALGDRLSKLSGSASNKKANIGKKRRGSVNSKESCSFFDASSQKLPPMDKA